MEHRRAKVAGITTEVHAEKRMALLIGIETIAGEIGRLANPHVAMLEKPFKGLSPWRERRGTSTSAGGISG